MKSETNPKCNQYKGDYYDDKKHGEGHFQWESGNYYIGSYLNDLRHGYGEMYWADGQNYKGDWEYGVQHGFGEITLVDGRVKKGKFENNVYMGKVKSETKKPEPLDESKVKKKKPQFVDSGITCNIKISYDIMT